jgi:hypothetical protein
MYNVAKWSPPAARAHISIHHMLIWRMGCQGGVPGFSLFWVVGLG